ncbi:MAG: hypothetical protein PHP52_07905 [Bacteroidales bacterium]|nr:hypothetical protein [Bacteroidales bacterium]MDD4217640.1 hypothetical protein [Bacteroidales bacterium]MDY0142557.1 hypothetical protein [Bacteroidales bacterium]
MRKIVSIVLLGLMGLPLFAQVKGGVHKKLAEYYQKEQWEDCAFKADRMILKEKYRNDAEVYLYLAASYNKIFLMGLEDSTMLMKVPEYAQAYKLALKHSVFSKKKDRKAGFYYPENNNMLEEIAISGIYYVEHYVESGKVSKANSYVRKIMKTYTDINIYFLHGSLSAMIGDMETAKEVFDSVFNTMNNRTQGNVQNTEFMMLEGFDLYVNHLISLDEPLLDSAKYLTMKGLQYFPDNEILKWNLQKIDNPESTLPKPENILKSKALKAIAINLTGDDDDIEEEDDDE